MLKITSPEEAVMECLKKRGEEPDRCSPVRIAEETGMPRAVVLAVIGGVVGVMVDIINDRRDWFDSAIFRLGEV